MAPKKKAKTKRKHIRRAAPIKPPETTVFALTAVRLKAAQLIAADDLSDEQIAQECDINRRTLADWKDRPEFRAKVGEYALAIESLVFSRGIANRVRRVRALNNRWEKLQQVIAERAVDPQMATVPGGMTGLLVHQVKSIGRGADMQVIDEYVLDAALLANLLAHEKQAAQELGQVVNKVAPTSPDGNHEYAGTGAIFSDDEKRAILIAICTRLGLVNAGSSQGGSVLTPGPALAGFLVDHGSGGNGTGPVADDSAEFIE